MDCMYKASPNYLIILFCEFIGHLASTFGCPSPLSIVTADCAYDSSIDIWHVNCLFIQ